LIDEMHIAIAPVLLGAGERLFDNLDGASGGFTHIELLSSASVAHMRFTQ
jgi:dihydrofolate reductase